MTRQTKMTKRSRNKIGKAVKSPARTTRIKSMLARISNTIQPNIEIGGFAQDQVGPISIESSTFKETINVL